jgi:hypothetical protein
MTINFVQDTLTEYLNGEGISESDIRIFLKSPRLFYYHKNNNENVELERHIPIAMAVNEMIFYPDHFKVNYLVCPTIDKRTKEGKEQFALFAEQAKGKNIVYDNEMEMIIQTAANARMNKSFMDLLNDSYYQFSCYTIDEKTGLPIRMRPDVLPKTNESIVEFKICLDASPRKFNDDVNKNQYSISAALHIDFLRRNNFVFAAIEKSPPYQASLYMLSESMIEYGRTQYRMALDLIKWSIDNNYWCDHVEFEILKECYALESLDNALEKIQQSELIKILE